VAAVVSLSVREVQAQAARLGGSVRRVEGLAGHCPFSPPLG